MNKTKVAALLSLLLSGVVAAQDPFYTITEVATGSERNSLNVTENENSGPWALSISGDGTAVSSLVVKSNWYLYFQMSPSGMDLAHRFRYEGGCSINVLSTTACSAYLDKSNFAADWFKDLSSSEAQTQTHNWITASASTTASIESDGVITRYGRNSNEVDSVGYASLANHGRKAIATLNGASIDITDGSDSAAAFASAYDVIPLSSGTGYLVVGTSGLKKSDDAINKCYSGSKSNINSYSPYCPGFTTKTSFWTVTSSGVSQSKQVDSYYISKSTDYPYTASALKVALVNGEYIAVGYSATWGYNHSSTGYPKNLATYWNLSDGSLTSDISTNRIFSFADQNPGTKDDYTYDNGWAVDINENGYIIGNRIYRKPVKKNYPIETFYARYGTDSSGKNTIIETAVPFSASSTGGNTEAAALNNHEQVVGWTDERNANSDPVNGSVSRLQEAFLYRITNSTNKKVYINDLICGKDDITGAKSCVQNSGKYYYIEYANDILDDGTILASARRYDSYDNWKNLTSGTNVVVKLTISSSAAFDSSYDVPTDYIVENKLPAFDYGASSGGGSFGVFGLLAMAGAALVGQYRRFVKKPS